MKLIIEDDEGRKTAVPFVREELTIGRQEGNTIRLTERNVSRRHARLLRQNGSVLVEDLGSYNGIRVNGDRIAGQVKINDGDLIQIGDYDLAIQAEEGATKSLDATRPLDASTSRLNTDATATMPYLPVVDLPIAPAADTRDLTPPPLASGKNQSTAVIRLDQIEGSKKARALAAVPMAEAPRLVVLNTEFAGKEFVCNRTEVKIGRTEDNEVALDHRSLSRTHCKLVREESGEWRVIDMQSANGLMVNGENYAQITLRPGDVIELGHVKLKFVGPGENFTVGSSSSAVPTQENGADVSNSKAPLIAMVSAVAALLLLGGGYLFWKSGQPPVGSPTKKPTVAAVIEKPVVKTEVNPDVETPVMKEDPAVAQKANSERIAKAKLSAAKGDFAQAELLLSACKVEGALHPEAKALMQQLDVEGPYLASLIEAEKLLDDGKAAAAQSQLATAANTELLKDRYTALEARRAAIVRGTVAQNSKPVEVKAVEGKPAPLTAEELYAEVNPKAIVLKKDRKFKEAIALYEKVLKIDPKFADAHMKLGSLWAAESLDVGKAQKHYQTFLQYADPSHANYGRVEAILKDFGKGK